MKEGNQISAWTHCWMNTFKQADVGLLLAVHLLLLY